jgi:hypothetical protein
MTKKFKIMTYDLAMDNKIDFIANSQVTQETVWGMPVEVSIFIHAHTAHQTSQALKALRVTWKLTGNVGVSGQGKVTLIWVPRYSRAQSNNDVDAFIREGSSNPFLSHKYVI